MLSVFLLFPATPSEGGDKKQLPVIRKVASCFQFLESLLTEIGSCPNLLSSQPQKGPCPKCGHGTTSLRSGDERCNIVFRPTLVGSYVYALALILLLICLWLPNFLIIICIWRSLSSWVCKPVLCYLSYVAKGGCSCSNINLVVVTCQICRSIRIRKCVPNPV